MVSFFLQMFTRGRYVSLRSLAAAEADEAAKEDKPKHQERERFSVAATAFCIEHDKAFKRHFLKVAAKLSPEKIDEVILEPDHCADLLLQGKRHVLVFEFKLGALLQDHQNPKTRLFSEYGYGAKIRGKFTQPGKELRYVVIGKEFDPCIRQGLHCSSVPWRKLVIKGQREGKLEKDLYDCLGHLGAPVFLHRHMKKLKLAREAEQGMAAYGFLEQVLSKEGLLSGGAESDGKTLGLNIKRIGEGTLHRKLIGAVQPKGQKLGWIGYSTWGTEFVHQAVGFYCSNKTAETKLRKRLEAVKGLGEVVNDGLHIYVDQKREGSTDDAEWFKKVLKTAAGS
jgi:hypothetical protein